MLRESYADKYDEKSKLDNKDIRLLKEEDDDYFMYINRPLSEKTINKLPEHKMKQFVQDVMINKKMINLLYSSNSNIEEKHYLKSYKVLEENSEKKSKKKKKPKPTLVKEWAKREAYFKMSKEINKHHQNKKSIQMNLNKRNNKKYMVFKTQSEQERNAYFEPLRENRKNQYLKTFYSLKDKLHLFKGNNSKKQEVIIGNPHYKLSEEPHYQYIKTFSLPNIKLDVDNVYSRLYHNTVSLSMSNLLKKNYLNQNTIKLNSKLSLLSDIEGLSDRTNGSKPKKSMFNIKKVNKNSDGREFTIKKTEDIFNKCFFKYSGGPEGIKMIQKFLIDDMKSNRLMREDGIDYYKLITDNGNSLLHIIILENQIEMVKYFLDKGTNPDIQNINGDTPLHISVRNQNFEIITMLLEYGAQINITNKKNEIPFDLATTEIRCKFPIKPLY